jgi:hypothetical protein
MKTLREAHRELQTQPCNKIDNLRRILDYLYKREKIHSLANVTTYSLEIYKILMLRVQTPVPLKKKNTDVACNGAHVYSQLLGQLGQEDHLSLSLRPAWATQVDPFLKKFITTMFGYN